MNARLITRIPTDTQNPVENRSQWQPCDHKTPCPARLRHVKNEKQAGDGDVNDGDKIERTMKNKRLRHADNNRNDRHDSDQTKGILWRCGIGGQMITIALSLPKLESVAETLDELAHRP